MAGIFRIGGVMSAPLVVEMNGQSVGIQLLTWADDGKRKQQQQQQEIVTYRSTHTHTAGYTITMRYRLSRSRELTRQRL